MREKILSFVHERTLVRAGDRVAVALSGGADSVALLRVLLELRAELGIVLAVAHFNHQLRGAESDADEAFVSDLACETGLEFFVGRADVRQHACASKLSVEAAGRELRYEWLGRLACQQRFDSVATAHTLDDQAETVLLKFLRGAGTRGLAGIYPEMFRGADQIRMVRPMLCVTRHEVESYLSSLGQGWREDESNLDHRFARNRARHELLPLLEREYNPNVCRVLSDTAELARAEEEYWQALVQRELHARALAAKAHSEGDALNSASPRLHPVQQCFSLANFMILPLALRRRMLRGFAESQGLALDFEHVEKLLRCARGDAARTDLPGGWTAVRRGDCLDLGAPTSETAFAGYEYSVPIPGEVHITELGLTLLRAVIVGEEFARESADTSNFLSAELLAPVLTVRNWRPGDRFWPAHSGSEEKLKRLFAEKHIPAEQRASWPVLLSSEQIAWVRGFPVARAFAWKGFGIAIRIDLVEPQ